MKHSTKSLMGYGIDSTTAAFLVDRGYGITKLRACSIDELQELKLSDDYIEIIRSGSRSPIPAGTVTKLLADSAMTCCVCTEKNCPVIIHHIEEYSNTRDHSEGNLVVLCLNDHGRAHSTGTMSRGLSADVLREMKQRWNDAVSDRLKQAVRLASDGDYATWGYINTELLFELADRKHCDYQLCSEFRRLRLHNIVSDDGYLNALKHWDIDHPPRIHLHNFSIGAYRTLYLYFKDILGEVLGSLRVVDLREHWDRNEIKSLVKSGDCVLLYGNFRFRQSKVREGRGQIRTCYRKAGSVRVTCTFDAWDCTASSAWHTHYAGQSEIAFVGFVRSMIESEGVLEVKATPLAFGTCFEGLRVERPISPTLAALKYAAYDDEEE